MKSIHFALSCLLSLCLASPNAYACMVCFGDPDSKMTKGVVWGVYFLVAVIAAVLVTIAVIGQRWAKRDQSQLRTTHRS